VVQNVTAKNEHVPEAERASRSLKVIWNTLPDMDNDDNPIKSDVKDMDLNESENLREVMI